MNFIDHNWAYSLYPRSTLEDRVGFVMDHAMRNDNRDAVVASLKDCQRWGWKIVGGDALGIPSADVGSLDLLPEEMWSWRGRSVDDDFTWKVPLFPSHRRGVISTGVWHVADVGELAPGRAISFHIINLPTIKYVPTNSTEDYGDGDAVRKGELYRGVPVPQRYNLIK